MSWASTPSAGSKLLNARGELLLLHQNKSKQADLNLHAKVYTQGRSLLLFFFLKKTSVHHKVKWDLGTDSQLRAEILYWKPRLRVYFPLWDGDLAILTLSLV